VVAQQPDERRQEGEPCKCRRRGTRKARAVKT
jgi:hypothetical protein